MFSRISIHAPRTGSDVYIGNGDIIHSTFQSTLPARGATDLRKMYEPEKKEISIHAPRTGSDTGEDGCLENYINISIHAPRTGSDQKNLRKIFKKHYFNPRSPHGERRKCSSGAASGTNDFNPRSPHGERLRKVTILSIRIIGFAQKVYHKTVLLRISLAENAVILPEKPRNPVRTSLQKAGGLRFARAIRAARPYSISSPSGA